MGAYSIGLDRVIILKVMVCKDMQKPFGLGGNSGFSNLDFRFMN